MILFVILCSSLIGNAEAVNAEAHKSMDKLIHNIFEADTKNDLEKVLVQIKNLEAMYSNNSEVKTHLKENFALIHRDLDYFLNLKLDKQQRFFEIKSDFTKAFFTRNVNPILVFPRLNKYCNDFQNEFSESVFLKNFILIRKGYFMALFIHDSNLLDELLRIATILEDPKVANGTSAVGNFFEIVGCYYLFRDFDYKNSLLWYEKAEKHNLRFYDSNDLSLYTDYGYILKCLSEENKANEAFNRLDKLDSNKFDELLNNGDSYYAFAYFSAKSNLLLKDQKLKLALEFQVTAFYFLEKIPNANKSLVLAEATRLRDLYCKSKEWTSMRGIESRHNLKPIPKQPGEQ